MSLIKAYAVTIASSLRAVLVEQNKSVICLQDDDRLNAFMRLSRPATICVDVVCLMSLCQR